MQLLFTHIARSLFVQTLELIVRVVKNISMWGPRGTFGGQYLDCCGGFVGGM